MRSGASKGLEYPSYSCLEGVTIPSRVWHSAAKKVTRRRNPSLSMHHATRAKATPPASHSTLAPLYHATPPISKYTYIICRMHVAAPVPYREGFCSKAGVGIGTRGSEPVTHCHATFHEQQQAH